MKMLMFVHNIHEEHATLQWKGKMNREWKQNKVKIHKHTKIPFDFNSRLSNSV